MEDREDAGTIQVPVHTIAGGTDFVHNYALWDVQTSATRTNDYFAPGITPLLQPLDETVLINVEMVDSNQLEETESFTLEIRINSSRVGRYLFDCPEVEITIEDDDTADTTVRIANGANAAFTDFVNGEARVTEGNTIKLEVSLPAERGNCIVPFPLNAWVTASGDVSVIDQSGFTTTSPVGTPASGLRIPHAPVRTTCWCRPLRSPATRARRRCTSTSRPTKTRVSFSKADVKRCATPCTSTTARQVHSGWKSTKLPRSSSPPPWTGSSLTLAFDETLDSVTVPTSLFTVNVNGAARSVMGVAVGQTHVTLLLSPAVEAGDTVTLDYTAPTDEDTAKVQDPSGNAAASFSGQAVTNETGGGGGGGGQRSDEQDPPGVPESLEVARQHSGRLKAAWETPGSGPAPTGYTLQWKAAADA